AGGYRCRPDDAARGRSAPAGVVLVQRGGVRARGRARPALGNGRPGPGHYGCGGAGRATHHRGALLVRRVGRRHRRGAGVSIRRPGAPPLLVSPDSPDGRPSLDARDALERARAALGGAAGVVLVRPATASRDVLERLPPGASLAAVLPDMPQLVREVADRGAINAALRRLRRGGLGASLQLADTVLRNLLAVARQDFRGIVPVLIALDRARLGAAALQVVVLAAPLTDLLMAAGHRTGLAHVVRFIRGRLGAQAALETLNLGHLLPRLDAWGVAPDFVVGPVNPRGFRMKPSPES